MGKENADAYGKRNSVKGELLLRIKASKVIAQKNIAEQMKKKSKMTVRTTFLAIVTISLSIILKKD